MAHYRKMTVDGIEYQYNIGKKFVEIREELAPKQLIEKSEIGFKSKHNELIVHPKMIADYIQGKKKQHVSKYFRTCKCVGVSKQLGVIPYDYEIDNKSNYVYWCSACYSANADDI